MGNLAKISNRFVINVKLINVETAETVSVSQQMYGTMDELLDDLNNIAEMLGNF